MNLRDNPIFITQKRLVHRGGVLASIIVALIVSACLFAGLLANLDHSSFHSDQASGKVFYGWIVGLEIIILIVGGSNRISNTLGNERKNGLWDSNRLTPLKPWQLVVGYWFGAPLREVYMAVIFAATGLAIVLFGGLPPTLWLGTQVLILSTALFFGLLSVLAGLVFQRPQTAAGFVVGFIFLQFPAFAAPKFAATNFLLPIYAIANLFMSDDSRNDRSVHDWTGMPEFFGMAIHPVLLSLALQLVVGIFLWRAAVRKTANPFRPPLFRSEAVALFAILLVIQHALMWMIWHGQYPLGSYRSQFDDWDALVPVVHAATLVLAAGILAGNSPQPQTVRLAALRTGFKDFRSVFATSSVSLALILAGVGAAVLATQFLRGEDRSWKIYFIAIGNLLSFFLVFSLLLEFCRVRFGRRSPGFTALWLFILCILPFILAFIFSSSAIAQTSLLAPGVVALADVRDQSLDRLLGIVIAHFGVAFLLFIAWRREWKQLLAKAI